MDRKIFFDGVRNYPSNSKLTKRQVDGMEVILNEWQQRQLTDSSWLAYILATAYHETAFTMESIDEYGKGRGREYGIPDAETGHIYYARAFWYALLMAAGEVEQALLVPKRFQQNELEGLDSEVQELARQFGHAKEVS